MPIQSHEELVEQFMLSAVNAVATVEKIARTAGKN